MKKTKPLKIIEDDDVEKLEKYSNFNYEIDFLLTTAYSSFQRYMYVFGSLPTRPIYS